MSYGGYPPQGGYGGYPPQGGYGGYPQQGAYPQQPAYPPQPGYPPQGGYGGYPQPGAYPQQPGYAQPPAYMPPVGNYPTLETYGMNIAQNLIDQDCQMLRAAMKGIGTDEKAIINILTSRSNAHRYMLKQRYKTLLGRDLVKDLKSELSGSFEDVCIALLESPYELDCRSLYEAMDRLGTNEETLIEIVATRPNHQLYQDRILFQQLYKRDLIKYVESETSGHFRKILVAILQCQRHELDYPINEAELRMEAQRLYQAGEGRLGTDETIFTQIFSIRSPVEIAAIASMYKEMSGHDLYKTLKKEFSGNAETLLKAIFNASISPQEYFATRIKKALESHGTKDKQLIRIIVSRAEIDLNQIKQCYQKLYGKDLVKAIKEETSGDYKKILVEICNKCV